jgi:hypothetical protein
MADKDDDDLDVETEFEPIEEEVEEIEEVVPDDLDEDALEDEEFAVDEDDAFSGDEDALEDDGDDEGETAPRARVVGGSSSGDEDEDDDDLLAPDDVEADLDTILKDRLVTAEENADEDDDAEVDDPRTDPGDRLQPKRPDELLCSNCFLLVRTRAPGCPMGDDTCPIFES